MIYEQKGLNKKEYTPVFGDEDDFSHLAGNVASPKTTAYRHTEQQLASFKQVNAPYVLYGTLANDNMERAKNEVLERSVMFIDVDDSGTYEDVANHLASFLNAMSANYVIYPTISNGIKDGTRLRAGIQLDKSLNQDDYIKTWLVVTGQTRIKADQRGAKSNFAQLQGIYVPTDQNAANKPIIETDGVGLNTDVLIELFNNNPNKYQPLDKQAHSQTPVDISNTPKYALVARKMLLAMFDPENSYQAFGGWDNMLTGVGGWVYRQTHGDIKLTGDIVATVNALGSDPIAPDDLKAKFKSWVNRWTY
ncbi:hypothetical protein ACGYLH_10410 [Weissella confusa]|uniref:hypothetical protein n=1 Tax=Weissella confusa TaxID=1583 RepID=UPI003746F8D1